MVKIKIIRLFYSFIFKIRNIWINRNKIKLRVWERGAGLTLACGSGACASVYAGTLKNLLENEVEVILERGSLYINIVNDEAIMTGPAEISFYGSLDY